MNTKIKGLRTCIYKVSNIEEAKKWYSTIFETTPYFEASCYVGFNIEGYELGLQPETENISNKTDNVITYWGVDEINLMFNRCLELKATLHESPVDVGEGIMMASVKDPWDNIIGLIYNPYFKIQEN